MRLGRTWTKFLVQGFVEISNSGTSGAFNSVHAAGLVQQVGETSSVDHCVGEEIEGCACYRPG